MIREQAKLTAAHTANDDFGISVAVSGDTVVVGAYGAADAGPDSGSAYVFVRSGGSWTEQDRLTASDATAGDHFGNSVAVSGDTVVVGAYRAADAGPGSGSAYVFVRSGGSWTEQDRLTASDAAADDRFGRSVAVSGDTVVVGAYGDDDPDYGSMSGSAYVFVRSGGSWTERAMLTADEDSAADDYFGRSVAVSGDTVVVGAYGDDDGGSRSGSAYVFVRTEYGYDPQAKLTAADAAADDFFGRSVAVSGDTVVVGAYGDDDDGSSSGSAYVFVRSGGGWTQQPKLTATDAAAYDVFGYSVAVSGDTVVVGAHCDDDAGDMSGAVYVFARSGSGWTEQAKLTAADADADDKFGVSVAVSDDTLAVGAYGDADAGPSSGSAYVFDLDAQPGGQEPRRRLQRRAARRRLGGAVSPDNGQRVEVGSVRVDADAHGLQVEVFVDDTQIAALRAQGVELAVGENLSEIGRARQHDVGREIATRVGGWRRRDWARRSQRSRRMQYLNVTEVESAMQGLSDNYPSTCELIALPEATHEGADDARRSNRSRPARQPAGDAVHRWSATRGNGEAPTSASTSPPIYSRRTTSAPASPTRARRSRPPRCARSSKTHRCSSSPWSTRWQITTARPSIHGGRKNRNPVAGVDLNRNYDFLWDLQDGIPPGCPRRCVRRPDLLDVPRRGASFGAGDEERCLASGHVSADSMDDRHPQLRRADLQRIGGTTRIRPPTRTRTFSILPTTDCVENRPSTSTTSTSGRKTWLRRTAWRAGCRPLCTVCGA